MTGGTYSITVKEKGHTNSDPNPQNYCILKRVNSTSSWQSLGTHNVNTQNESGGIATAVRSELTSFSQFGIGKSASTLPIELIFFKAEPNENLVNLSWATGCEINNDYFTLERSSDGKHFDELLKKKGLGNSTQTKYYSAVDDAPLAGSSYYRLKQTDFDGKFTYSQVKSVSFGMGKSLNQKIGIESFGPNPFSDNFRLTFTCESESNVRIQLVNISGTNVFTEIINAEKGNNSFEYDNAGELAPGAYFLSLSCNGSTVTKKLIKK
jgi:hypothetical protein